jgi:hypothetical protein
MADVHWMTYAELSEALSIGLDSAKNLARRKRWGRQRGNDGLAKIGVPREALERRPKPMAPVAADGPLNPPIDAPTSPPTDRGSDGPSALDVLHRHIERLETELSAQRAEREAERQTLRVSLEALKQALESERQHKAELRRELELARRPWWRRLAG